MNAFFAGFERAGVFGLVALGLALLAQQILDGRAPAAWRVWIWRAALLQTALVLALGLVGPAPLRLAVLPPSPPLVAPEIAPENAKPLSSGAAPFSPLVVSAPLASSPNALSDPNPAPAPPVKSTPAKISLPAPISALPAARRVSLRAFLVTLYALGIGFQLFALVGSLRRVRRTMRACQPIANAEIGVQVGEIARRMRVSPLPRLLQSEGGAPFLVGIFRPAIAVPRALLEAQNSDLSAVLSHEMAHLQRRDLVWNALLWGIETVLWFHPLTWIARRFLALETECACDEMVLSSTRITPQSYGALLLNTMNTQQTPLTAGVADGFFALKTRLIRLNQAPRRPRRAWKIAFASALGATFIALMPLEFVARAQNPTAKPPVANFLGGKVVDQNGKPVAGATLYLLTMTNRKQAPETALSDATGVFRFSAQLRDRWGIDVFVDAGDRGMGQGSIYFFDGRKSLPAKDRINVQIARGVRAKLRFLDPQRRPVPNLGVRLWRIGQSQSQWLSMPRVVRARLKATTDANGEAIFPPLPDGKLAQFVLRDEVFKITKFGLGDHRGGRFAPLSTEDFVTLKAPETSQTIRLLNPIEIKGRVSFPDGRDAGNVLILARRINAAEAAGKTQNREQLIAQTRSNAAGKYVLTGLRPGRYYVWTYPEKQLTRDYVGQTTEKSFAAKTNTVDFALSRGALIQGVVLAQNTKLPVKGQTLGLRDSQENYQYAITDARGFFQFRALGGKQHLWVHANGSNSPPPGFILPAKAEFDFSIKNGEKRQFSIEMPRKPVVKPVTGLVIGLDGKPVANATINVEGLGGTRDYAGRRGTLSDANGRFSLPIQSVMRPARLLVTAGELRSARGTIVRSGDDVTLQVEPNVLATVEGQILDKKTGKPLQNVNVVLRQSRAGLMTSGGETRTDADGRFRFSGVRPLESFYLHAYRKDYGEDGTGSIVLSKGQTQRFTIFMHPLSTTLRGRVVGEDGRPASGFRVSATGSGRVSAQADGTFFLPRVLDEKIQLWISTPKQSAFWGPIWTRGGRSDVEVRLTKELREMSDSLRQKRFAPPRTLRVGQIAPELRTLAWDEAPQSLRALRGRVVLLNFDAMDGPPSILSDLARSFGARGVQVLGLKNARIVRGATTPSAILKRIKMENDIAFPVALDAPLQTPGKVFWLTGQSGQSYGGARFAVIGRDGRVAYAGDELDRAITLALTMPK